MRVQKRIRIYAIAMLAIYLPQLLLPVKLLALTGGPSQPEVQSFEPVGTSEMVDLFSGDFNYNIPLLDVGGYPVNISYHSGITMDQEATWVGLGWNINPGVINRSMRGIPDDHNGDLVKKESNIRTDWTLGVTANGNFELFGMGKINPSSLGVFYNNYRGVGYEIGFGGTLPLAADKLKGSLNVNFNSHSGIDVNPSLSFATKIGKEDDKTKGNYGFSVSGAYNSRGGLKSLTLNQNLTLNDNSFSGSSTISFGTQTWTPNISMPMSSLNLTLKAAFGGDAFGAFAGSSFRGYYTRQKLRERSATKRSYGYMYLGNSYEDNILLDFNREKDGEFSDNATNLAIPQLTYDIYSVSGQGIGGMYRLHRSDYGAVFDHAVSSESGGGSLGFEFGAGGWAHFGANLNVNFSTTKTSKWSAHNDFIKSMDFEDAEKIRNSNPFYEGAFFKNAGEKTPVDASFQSIIGDTQLVKIPVGNHDWERPFAQSKLVDFNYSKNVYGSKADNVKKVRDKRMQTISYLTATEAKYAALDKTISNYQINGAFNNGVLPKTVINRGVTGGSGSHISEMTTTSPDGRRYVYGIPAYNTKQIEKTFNIYNNGVTADCSTGQVNYTNSDDTKDNNNGDNHYFTSVETPPFAHSYLLTSILSSDYVDITGDGISDDDIGTAVKINYSRAYDDYKWRLPYNSFKANYEEGLKFTQRDDKASYVYGEKEIWHMHSVESKNQIAVFKISNRADGYGVIDEDGGLNYGYPSYKLDSIVLYSKQDYIKNGENAEPIKVVHFEYDYSLCPNVENNNGSTITVDGNNINANKGKLTLKKIFFTYGSSQKGRLTPYTFEYDGINPAYNLKGYDRWGNYAPNNGSSTCVDGGVPTTAEFPYTTQNKDSADSYMAAWSLTKINLPMGGSINVTYEADDYAYVQDKQAMQMAKILGFSNNNSFSNASNYLYTHAGTSFSDSYNESNYLFFRLKDPITGSGTAEKLAEQYFTGVDDMYFNVFSDINGKGQHEYVRGYAEIDRGATDCFGVTNDTIGWVKLKTERIGDRENAGAKVQAIAKASWNFARLYTPQLVYPFSYANETEGPGASANPIIALLGFATDAKRMLQGFNRSLRQEGYGKTVQLSKSWIRVNVPDKFKLGGGVRVKRIAINDNWAAMGAENTDANDFEYGQEYTYTTTEKQSDGTEIEISSGVASYEPMVGNEENPWRKPVYTTKENKLAPDERFYKEEPFGESFFPSPSVGYSKITVKNLAHENVVRKAAGYQVHEFYTAYDFPTKVSQTGLDKFHKKPNPVLKLFNIEVREKVTASQGYLIELNDMHGKPKAMWTHAENTEKPLSGMQYFYKEIKNQKKLNNKVQTVSKDGAISTKTVGMDIDFVTDMREQVTKSYSGGLQFNTEVIPAWLIPCVIPIVLPSFEGDQSFFNSAVTCKVINRYGILEKTMAYQEGSIITTENILFDDETGEVLLTSTQNEFKDNLYNFTYPAHWAYEGMAGAYKNTGLILYNVKVGSDTIILPNGLKPRDYLMPGDQVLLIDNSVVMSSKEAWVYDGNNKYNLIDRNGKPILPFTNPSRSYTLKVTRSARRNMQNVPIGAITSLSNPASSSTLAFSNIIDAASVEFSDRWPTFCDYFKLYDCNDTILSQQAYDLETLMNYLAQDSLLGSSSAHSLDALSWYSSWFASSSIAPTIYTCDTLTADTTIYYLPGTGYSVPTTSMWFSLAQSDAPCCSFELISDTSFDYGEIRSIDSMNVDFNQNLNGANYNFTVIATLKNGNKVTLSGVSTCFNLITCNYTCGAFADNYYKTVNPYLVGLRGNWRKTKDYKYLEERNYSSNIAIRNDATYKTFSPYWAYNTSSKYVESQNNGKWVWASEVTKYNPFGEEIENKDALGRYTAALYGYNNTLPVAVGSNAKYQQLAFDGFEDYNYLYSENPCQLYHWNFKTSIPSTAKLDSIEQHSGAYSLKVNPNTQHSVERQIVTCSDETPNTDSAVMYKFKPCDCIGLFSPDTGKYVFSGWIKDSTSVLDTTYSEPTIRITITTGTGTSDIDLKAKGPIIDGWQRVEEYITLPFGTTLVEVVLMAGDNPTWFDDLRMHPFDGNMKTFVYHPISLKLYAELDENNFATFYEYDKEGALIRVKKETVNGVMTIKESRNSLIKQ
jgi:hypothetical protein